jgi:predicted MFS family arabinose efflux permease
LTAEEDGVHEVDSRRALAAMAGVSLAAGAANLTLPLWLGATVEGLGASERAVALVASGELGCLALAALVAAPRLGRVSRRALAVAGLAGVALGNAGAALAPSLAVLAAARALAGLGAGVAMAAMNATAAGTALPERTYALVFVLGGAGCAGLMLAMPLWSEPYGTAGAFGVLLAGTLAVAPLAAWMPPHPPAPEDGNAPDGFPRGAAVVAALAASLLVTIGLDALWPFAERIGRRAGMSAEAIGALLAATSLVVLAVAAFASWLGVRVGRAAPLAAGFAVFSAAALALGHARSPAVFAPAVLLLGAGFFFTQPFMMGAIATLDRQGRVNAAAGALMTVGAAVGPAVGGVVVADGAGYGRLGWLAAGCGLGTLALIGAVALRAGRAVPLASHSAANEASSRPAKSWSSGRRSRSDESPQNRPPA